MTAGAFDTVLVANRGEIAVRVMRTARALGFRTVAVCSEADAAAPHVLYADAAVAIGPAEAARSYLDIDRILDAAARSGAQAVHPGYGFLAENADLAQACADAGLVFVGPPPAAIRAMGDKAEAKRRMADAGVPLLPGYQGEDQDDATLLAQAEAIGLPLMVKAAAGGGGKGMRLVDDAARLPEAIAAARREAAAAFGSDVLILERAVLRPRHVEIQVLADASGHTIALGERDCSVQRRHQKVLEEAPSPAVDDALRADMSRAAVAAAKAVGYVGAGTVEFLLAPDRTFAFLEMNTRLQVEHPVTELVTGTDLVAWQLRIARGEPLTLDQSDVGLTGHAIEARLYAEDPARGFLPATGTVAAWAPPDGPAVRVDAGIAAGSEVTVHYDPLLAKLIAHGPTRDEARRQLADALDRTTVLGPVTNRAFLAAVLRSPAFAAGEATTAFLDEPVALPEPASRDIATVAAWLHAEHERDAGRRSPGLAGWSSNGRLAEHHRFTAGERTFDVAVLRERDGLRLDVDGIEHRAELTEAGPVVDGVRTPITAVRPARDRVLAHLPHVDLDLRDVLLAPPGDAEAAGAGVLGAPMHGAVIEVAVAVGDRVAAGQRLLVLEAMKMEHEITADVDGAIEAIVAAGSQVAGGDVLARIGPDGAEAPD